MHLNFASSSAPPLLLVALEDLSRKKLLLVSLPNPHASSSSSYCVPYKDLSLLKIVGKVMYNAVRGFICVKSRLKVKILNPISRQLQCLPKIKFKDYPKGHPFSEYFFGYDPVEDQYKVLAIDNSPSRAEHKVLQVGRNRAWREAQCTVACPHKVHTSGLYMNGTVYYGASRTDIDSPNNSMIVSFDVKLETFKFIKVPSKVLPMGYENMWRVHPCAYGTDKTLINYKGKLGVVENPRLKGSFRMWVVEDAEKGEWSMNTYHLPKSAAGHYFMVMDTYSTGEICLVPSQLSDPFCLFYYNLEKNSMRNVIVEGLPISEFKHAYVTVSDYYESLMFLGT
ncbi:hypothetical protein EUTSA_v10011099mg [Eutrema salsugineum]|uniref:F-box associated beta-propeller type 3 domain-containing protein n=2 Tax=Eutrema salsugineum TaxID=72664 RepID=V4M112_EUTSA|nr:hypothetical protein EUTSA_v10011099mg [Eutrema salsugineum]